MRKLSIVLAAVAFLVLTKSARAEDCTKRPSQAEQIECLQGTVEALQQQVEVLLSRPILRFGHTTKDRGVQELSVEALIDEKIRRALEPRLHLLPR